MLSLADRGIGAARSLNDILALPGRCNETVSRPRAIEESAAAGGILKAARDRRRRRFAAS
jgi:hypothetical protein